MLPSKSPLGTLVAAILIAAPGVAAQTGTIIGKVTDAQTGDSVAAAQVFIAGLDLGALSRQSGRYQLQNVPAGTHWMTVARIGYQTRYVQIAIGGGQTLEQDFSVAQEDGPQPVRAPRQRQAGRFVEAMEARARAISPAELFQPVEVRATRDR